MNSEARILIIRLSSLGDILHSIPALSSLRAAFPHSQIDWLVDTKAAFLLSAFPAIDSVHVLDVRAIRQSPWRPSSYGPAAQVVRELRSRAYDVAIDFQGLLKTALLSRLSGARRRIGFSRELVREYPAHWFYHDRLQRPEQQLHVVQLNLLLAQRAGGAPVGSRIEPRLKSEDYAAVESMLRKEHLAEFIVINPGGGWPTKRWKPANYGFLAARIQRELGIPVVVTTGPGEEHLYNGIAGRCDSPPPRHAPLSFLQLAALFQKSLLVIGGDTGPFHLACALGIPAVGIFGPTSPVRNGPWRAEDEAVVRRLSCSFCNGRTCPTRNECMDLAVEEVFAAVCRRLERHS